MSNRKGFTLVELLAVVLIIGALTAVALPQYTKVVERAKVTEAISLLRSIYDSSERLAGDFGYKTYSQLVSSMSSTNAANYSFARFDMFDADNMPRGCAINDKTTLYCGCTSISGSSWTASCKFAYKITSNYVLAKKNNGKYTGTIIGLNKANTSIYCKSADSNACDMFGLDDDNSLTF